MTKYFVSVKPLRSKCDIINGNAGFVTLLIILSIPPAFAL